jgi:hypothetical protein
MRQTHWVSVLSHQSLAAVARVRNESSMHFHLSELNLRKLQQSRTFLPQQNRKLEIFLQFLI